MAFDRKANRRKYYLENKEKEKASALTRYYGNKERASELHKKWCKDNVEKIKGYRNNRYNTNLKYKLSAVLRSRHIKALKGLMKKETAKELLGCYPEELKVYLQTKFKKGMSWNNWSYRGWHIDHIIPIASFDLTDIKQQKKAFHYTNLQPLWRKENMLKSDKLCTK